MTVQELIDRLELKVFYLEDGDRDIENIYCGDLLSWVMGKCPEDACWVTIMSNQNVAAVGILCDCACVILGEDVAPDDDLMDRCEKQGVTLLGSPQGEYELCWMLKEAMDA